MESGNGEGGEQKKRKKGEKAEVFANAKWKKVKMSDALQKESGWMVS